MNKILKSPLRYPGGKSKAVKNILPLVPYFEEYREPFVDVIDDKEGNKIRIIAELPGIKKANIKITENQGTVQIKAENGDRKYNTDVPTGRKLDSPKSKATFTNGMLELEIPIKKSNDETDIRVD